MIYAHKLSCHRAVLPGGLEEVLAPRNTEGMHRLFTFLSTSYCPPSEFYNIAALNPAFSQCCHAIWCFLCRSFHARLSPWTLPPLSPMRRRGNNLFYRRLSQICPVDTRPELIIILDLGARVVARNIF